MKSSVIVLGASVLLASASPIEKREYKTDWVYEVVTVTVTEGSEPSGAVFLENPAPAPSQYRKHHTRPQPAPVVTTTAVQEAPQPEPTIVVVKPTAKEPAPEEPKSTLAAPPSVPSGDIPLTNLKQVILDHHNVHRANHSAPALTWDDTLAGYAENTANTCVFAHDMKQGGGGYGQNLASWGTSGAMDDLQLESAAMGVTDQWYNNEMGNWKTYGTDNPPSGLDINAYGHFTQLVWKSSTKVGCATVKCPAGTVLSLPSWYTVCNYNPPGNSGGQYGTNVLKPQGAAGITV